jgi:hypothetical protein
MEERERAREREPNKCKTAVLQTERIAPMREINHTRACVEFKTAIKDAAEKKKKKKKKKKQQSPVSAPISSACSPVHHKHCYTHWRWYIYYSMCMSSARVNEGSARQERQERRHFPL